MDAFQVLVGVGYLAACQSAVGDEQECLVCLEVESVVDKFAVLDSPADNLPFVSDASD